MRENAETDLAFLGFPPLFPGLLQVNFVVVPL